MYRIIYELDGRHTFWTREYDIDDGEPPLLRAVNVKTGQQKVISLATPFSITDVGDDVPPRVEEAIADE